MDDHEARETLRLAMDRFEEHEAEHGEDLDVDCGLCRADAMALGMGGLLPAARRDH